MTTLSESTMARSRCTTVVSRLSCGSYSTSATSVGSAGRGDTQSRPSPTWGGLTIWGPSARGLAASVVSGLPTGAGMGRVVSGAPAFGTGRPKPPLGPTPRRVPPNGGSSGGCGGDGGMIVINPRGRSIRHDPLNARTMIVTCATALTTQVSRRNPRPGPRVLDREERTRVHVVLHAPQRRDELRPPRGPREPPAGHAERFGQRVELDGDVARPRDLEYAGRHVSVEGDLAVGIVVHDDDPMLPTERDRALEVLSRRDRGSGIVGVVQVNELGTAEHIGRDFVQLQQETGSRRQRVAVRLGTREHGPALVHRVARLGDDRHIARVEQRHREM